MSGDGQKSSNKTHFVLFTLCILFPSEGCLDDNSPVNYFTVDDCISIGVHEGKEDRVKVFNISFILKNLFNVVSVRIFVSKDYGTNSTTCCYWYHRRGCELHFRIYLVF